MKPNEKNSPINPGERLDHALNAMRAKQPGATILTPKNDPCPFL